MGAVGKSSIGGGINLKEHSKLQEGKWSSLSDVPEVRLRNDGYSKPMYHLEYGNGYGTKVNGDIVYLQQTDDNKWIYNFGGVVASQKSYNSPQDAMKDLQSFIKTFSNISQQQKDIATGSLKYVNENGEVSPSDFNEYRSQLKHKLSK